MALTKKGKIGLGIGITIFVLLAIGGLLLFLFLAGAFGHSIMDMNCDYAKIVKSIDLQPKLIAESGLYECFDNYEGKLIVSTNKVVNNKRLLRGKEKAYGFSFYGNIGSICACTVENDNILSSRMAFSTFGEEGEMAENTGIKSTWGADIYYLPDRGIHLNRLYLAALYCDYKVNDNLYYRYVFFPDTYELSTEQAIEIFNKVFVLI